MPNWWGRSKASNLQPVPWLHPAVVLYLESLIKPGWKVLEHGSGGSTLWLAERCKEVVAVEHNTDYYAAVSKQLAQRENVRLILHAAEGMPQDLGIGYDLLLIDGEPLQQRACYLSRAEHLSKAGGVVVLDNANHKEYVVEREQLRRRAAHWITLDVNPPGHQYAVTEFYRMPGGVNWI